MVIRSSLLLLVTDILIRGRNPLSHLLHRGRISGYYTAIPADFGFFVLDVGVRTFGMDGIFVFEYEDLVR